MKSWHVTRPSGEEDTRLSILRNGMKKDWKKLGFEPTAGQSSSKRVLWKDRSVTEATKTVVMTPRMTLPSPDSLWGLWLIVNSGVALKRDSRVWRKASKLCCWRRRDWCVAIGSGVFR